MSQKATAPQESKALFWLVSAVILILMVTVFALARQSEKNSKTEMVNKTNIFKAASHQHVERMPLTFAAWKTLTSKNGELQEWQGASATILWVRPQLQYLNDAGILVYAKTPKNNFFVVDFALSEQGQLTGKTTFSELTADELVNVFKRTGQEQRIQALGLPQKPA